MQRGGTHVSYILIKQTSQTRIPSFHGLEKIPGTDYLGQEITIGRTGNGSKGAIAEIPQIEPRVPDRVLNVSCLSTLPVLLGRFRDLPREHQT